MLGFYQVLFSVRRAVDLSSGFMTLKNVTFRLLDTEIWHVISSGSDIDCGPNIQNPESQCFYFPHCSDKRLHRVVWQKSSKLNS